MINNVEQKMLNYLSVGENRLYVTEWHKQLGYSRPVIYKYLKTLANKGYIKPHDTDSVSGGTKGDKQRITIIYKLKEYNMYDKLLKQMVHYSSIKTLTDLDNKILKEISFTQKEYCFADFLSLLGCSASVFYKRVMKLSMIDLLQYQFIRGKTKKHIDCTLKIQKIDLTERYNNKLTRYELIHQILISIPDIKFIKEEVARERIRTYSHTLSDKKFFLVMEDIFWNNIHFGDSLCSGNFLYPFPTENYQHPESVKEELQEWLTAYIKQAVNK